MDNGSGGGGGSGGEVIEGGGEEIDNFEWKKLENELELLKIDYSELINDLKK